MINRQADTYLVIGIIVWLIILSAWQWKLKSFFARLSVFKGSDLKSILQSVIDIQLKQQKEHEQVEQKIDELLNKSKFHLQKIGLVRFDPFPDTGGRQSFALALLDELNNGIVIVSLHGREGSRFYTKTIKNGEGVEHPLSKEESQAIETAK